MLKINKIQDQLIQERNRRQELEDQMARQTANLDYVAMMAEVDIPEETTPDAKGGEENVAEV